MDKIGALKKKLDIPSRGRLGQLDSYGSDVQNTSHLGIPSELVSQVTCPEEQVGFLYHRFIIIIMFLVIFIYFYYD